ncbi:hypothetical protein [Limosilactobacillus reuteri]|uniref:hypothetical protein n=1 Tax=Limosilactobacillus reuteri TaxID=1598 RepID=UPI001E3B4BF7|nr:hypothetical protein [Limosilactobacillus reuteri]MCC4466744.1 hypothetical protein [Limosilactobacillus reuteri]MCC4474141.1 hypothetical protein [Limosilactobacillus reuteri]
MKKYVKWLCLAVLVVVIVFTYTNYNPLAGKTFAVYEKNNPEMSPVYFTVEKGRFHRNRHYIAEITSKSEAKELYDPKKFQKEFKSCDYGDNYLKYNNFTKTVSAREDADENDALWGDVTSAKVKRIDGRIIIKQGSTRWVEVK